MPPPWQPPDLDEIRAGRFVINNEKVRPFLRGEGERDGKFFQLQNWRREGWVARIRAAGFNVRTLQDRVDALPAVRRDIAVGPEGVRLLTTARERIAAWSPEQLRWRDLPIITVEDQPAVSLHVNEAVRRRKSRGSGDYFITLGEQAGRIGLRPVKETAAVMHAYSLLASTGRPAVLHFVETSDGYVVPADQALLPTPHRETLDLLARDGLTPWTFALEQAPLAEQVFERLGLELESRTPDERSSTADR